MVVRGRGGRKGGGAVKTDRPGVAGVRFEIELLHMHEGARRVWVAALGYPPVLQYLCATVWHAKGLPRTRVSFTQRCSSGKLSRPSAARLSLISLVYHFRIVRLRVPYFPLLTP